MSDTTVTLIAAPAVEWMPGRAMDVEIALSLMGWSRYDNGADLGPDYLLPPDGSALNARGTVRKVPHFSTKLEAAWMVAEKLRGRGFHMVVNDFHDLPTVARERQWQIAFAKPGQAGTAVAPTFWLAICRAALRTI